MYVNENNSQLESKMVIQTCPEVFSILMQLDSHPSFSADAVATLLNRSDAPMTYSRFDFSPVVSNDRTNLPFQK